MKRTELDRIEREVKRMQKREALAQKRYASQDPQNVGSYIQQLFNLFRYDEREIFNAQDDIAILELLEQMQTDIPERKWDDIIKKAIKKAGVEKKEKAFSEIKELIAKND